METIKKAFTIHKANGFLMTFPNGNTLSTVWGMGTYSDNYDYNPTSDPIQSYTKVITGGSNTVEVMVGCKPVVLELLEAKFGKASAGSSIFGHLTMKEWIEIVNILAKDYE